MRPNLLFLSSFPQISPPPPQSPPPSQPALPSPSFPPLAVAAQPIFKTLNPKSGLMDCVVGLGMGRLRNLRLTFLCAE
ncbi:hypothetical protein Droror1_Dr00015752 [Drosera rotundifolia]